MINNTHNNTVLTLHAFKIKQTKTHVFVPFHMIFFIALQGNGPEIQFTSALLKNFTYPQQPIIPIHERNQQNTATLVR